jgi:hypothetical protein
MKLLYIVNIKSITIPRVSLPRPKQMSRHPIAVIVQDYITELQTFTTREFKKYLKYRNHIPTILEYIHKSSHLSLQREGLYEGMLLCRMRTSDIWRITTKPLDIMELYVTNKKTISPIIAYDYAIIVNILGSVNSRKAEYRCAEYKQNISVVLYEQVKIELTLDVLPINTNDCVFNIVSYI